MLSHQAQRGERTETPSSVHPLHSLEASMSSLPGVCRPGLGAAHIPIRSLQRPTERTPHRTNLLTLPFLLSQLTHQVQLTVLPQSSKHRRVAYVQQVQWGTPLGRRKSVGLASHGGLCSTSMFARCRLPSVSPRPLKHAQRFIRKPSQERASRSTSLPLFSFQPRADVA